MIREVPGHVCTTLHMLNGFLGEQYLALSPIRGKACLERGTDDIVEEEGAVYEQTEANDLEPLE